MKVILLQDIAKIGKKFDIKEISNGYALNFLLPQKKVKMATNQTIKDTEAEQKKCEEARQIEQEEIRKGIEKIKDAPLEIKVKANADGKLFAGIDRAEIAKAIKEQIDVCVTLEMIELEKPIKETGECKIILKIGENKASLNLIIKKEE